MFIEANLIVQIGCVIGLLIKKEKEENVRKSNILIVSF